MSAFTASQVEALLNIPASRIRVIHHGVLPRKIPNLPREKIVLCVGAIQRRKNQAALVRAFRALPQDWQLVLAGSEGYEAAETRAAIDQSPCKNRIHVTGYISENELAEWYAKAMIFAFPSLDEGFGMPVLEAMAAGIPVITGNRSSLPEVAGEAAFLVNPVRDTELEEALQTLGANESRRNQFIEAGLERARQFPWEKAVNQTAEVYREIA